MGKVQLPVYVAQAEGAGEDERVEVKGRMRSFFYLYYLRNFIRMFK